MYAKLCDVLPLPLVRSVCWFILCIKFIQPSLFHTLFHDPLPILCVHTLWMPLCGICVPQVTPFPRHKRDAEKGKQGTVPSPFSLKYLLNVSLDVGRGPLTNVPTRASSLWTSSSGAESLTQVGQISQILIRNLKVAYAFLAIQSLLNAQLFSRLILCSLQTTAQPPLYRVTSKLHRMLHCKKVAFVCE